MFEMLKSSITKSIILIALVILGIGASVSNVKAQSQATTGQIQGVIKDEQGAVVSGASVTVKNKETGFTRSLVTDDGGRYNAPLLPLGSYEVLVSQTGFKGQSRMLDLALGSTVTADFKLEVQVESQVVEVTAGAVIEQTRTETSKVISDKSITDLPINGRRFLEFATLTPQVQVEASRGGISISGQRGINNNINIDGADFNNPFFGGVRGGERSGSTFTISQEAIREFQVVRAGYSAEFGRSTGGIINAVTKSGTNDFHGSLFYLNRHEQLSKKNALGLPATPNQQQFGGSIGGPIKKDKLFFFGAYDHQLNNAPLTVRFGRGGLPESQFPKELAALEVQDTQTNDVYALLGRVDYFINSSNNLSARYSFSKNNAQNGTNGTGTINRAIENNGLEKDRTNTIVATLTTTITSSILNEARGQYSREDRPRQENSVGPEINIGGGVGVFGGRAFLPIEQFDTRTQLADNLTIVTGRHTLKVGFDYNRSFVDQVFRSEARGFYNFFTLASYIARKPDQYRQFIGDGKFKATQSETAFYVQDQFKILHNLTISPGIRFEFTRQPQPNQPNPLLPQSSSIPNDYRQIQPRLGIAWDPFSNGKTVVRVSGGIFNARTPLLLLNQAFTNNGNPDVSLSLNLTSSSAIAAAQKIVPSFVFPNVFTEAQARQLAASLTQAKPVVAFFDPDFKNPRSYQFNASFEHEIAPKLVVGAEFSYIKGVYLQRLRDINLGTQTIDQTGRPVFVGARPNTNFSIMRSQESSAKALYRAVSFSATSRLNRRIQLLTFYTFASNLDNDSNERNFAGIQYENAFDLRNEYNFADSDIRHSFTTSGVFDLPYGFTVSTIVNLRSGRPFSPTTNADAITRTLTSSPADAVFGKPGDIVTAGGNNDGINTTDRPIVNGIALKRNSFRQPNSYNADLRILKSFNVFGEGRKLQLSLEFFNILNNKNITFAGAQTIFGPGDVFNITQNRKIVATGPQNISFMKKVDPNTGRIFTTNNVGTPFQMQVGARFIF